MLLDLNALRASGENVPAEWRPYVDVGASGFVVRGDRTSARELFLSTVANRVLLGDRLDELLPALPEGHDLDPFGISSLLHHGLIPPPFSEYTGIMFLTMGDVVSVGWEHDVPVVSEGVEYPWFADLSRGDSDPSETELLDLLTAATVRDVAGHGGQGFLMLSSGKDSVAIALALAEAGLTDIPCVTYSSGDADPEPEVAAEVCAKLGLRHEVVELPNDPSRVAAQLTTFFETSPAMSADLAQIPYVLAVAAANAEGGVVLDGGGNDAYMGFPVTGKWTVKTRYRIRGRALQRVAQRMTRVDSPLNYLARSRFETVVSGRMMRHHESLRLYPDSVNTSDHWAELSNRNRDLDMFDAYTILDRYITSPSSMRKHILAARAFGYEPGVPWCDHDLGDYFFNLPEPDRFDRSSGTGKVLLRRMLKRFLDYDADEVGKHYFAFDGPRFIAENKEFVRSEIAACGLWRADGVAMLHSWIDQIDKRPLLYHPILTAFVVSGWVNHSGFLSDVRSEVQQ